MTTLEAIVSCVMIALFCSYMSYNAGRSDAAAAEYGRVAGIQYLEDSRTKGRQ